MGGSEANNQIVCQICDGYGHSALQCSCLYMQCSKKNCQGIMLVLTSEQAETFGRRFLKCQYQSCGNWQWFEAPTCASSSNGCFECAESGHWAKDCPWKYSACSNGCEVPRKLLTSRQDRSKGQKFLKCVKCGSFQWLKDAIKKEMKNNIRVKIEVKLDDLCNAFKNIPM